MPARLIRLSDGVLVEIEAQPGLWQPISASDALPQVDAAIDKASKTLVLVCRSLAQAVEKISETVSVTNVEASVGLGFEAEGNLYVTKAKGTASIEVKISMAKAGSTNAK
jgi:hypothetical protein